MNTLGESVVERLQELVQRGKMTPEALLAVTEVVETTTEQWVAGKVSTLDKMIREWENVMDEHDKTLYSLGLRRAMDVVRERTALSELPILEKPDTPEE